MNKNSDHLVYDFNVRHFGATGDGQTDDTAAIQSAIDAAKVKGGGGVWLPPGEYSVSTLRLHSYVGLFANPTWSYHEPGGTRLKLNDGKAKFLLDLTGSYGARVVGLGLEGGELGEDICAVHIEGLGHKQEDTLFIERCRIAHFSGDGIRLDNVWGFTVRNNMVIFNGGDGLSFTRWDGWVFENIFNNNHGYGIHARIPNGAMSIVSNRIEWNHSGGVLIERGSHYHVNDNYIDRSGGPGIHIRGEDDHPAQTFSITGNIIHRSGARAEIGSRQSCHLLFENVAGLVCSGNAMHSGVNDSGAGTKSPHFGIIASGLECSIIRDNVLRHGAVGQLLLDDGGHDEQTIIRDNIGNLAPLEA